MTYKTTGKICSNSDKKYRPIFRQNFDGTYPSFFSHFFEEFFFVFLTFSGFLLGLYYKYFCRENGYCKLVHSSLEASSTLA
jgi:hypothetical protein